MTVRFGFYFTATSVVCVSVNYSIYFVVSLSNRVILKLAFQGWWYLIFYYVCFQNIWYSNTQKSRSSCYDLRFQLGLLSISCLIKCNNLVLKIHANSNTTYRVGWEDDVPTFMRPPPRVSFELRCEYLLIHLRCKQICITTYTVSHN